MLNHCRGKRKTWVTDSLTIQNPHGDCKGIDNLGTRWKEKFSNWEWGCAEKYNMYLKSSNRPQTTPVSISVALPQAGSRLYVNHTGVRVKKSPHKDSKSDDPITQAHRVPECGWLKPPGTAPLNRSKGFQKKWKNPNEHADIADINSSYAPLPSYVTGVRKWKTVDPASTKCGFTCQGTLQLGSKGLLGGVSPYSRNGGGSPKATRKPKRMVSPKKEITQTKLLREVERAREYAQDHKVGQALMINERGTDGGEGAIYLSKRVGYTCSQPFSHHAISLTPPSIPLSDAYAKNTFGVAKNSFGTPQPVGAHKRKSIAHKGAGDQHVGHHPLHRTTVNTPQQFVSRATYCQQLTTMSTQRGRSFFSGPTIVTPLLEIGEENISPTMGGARKMKGGMLMGSGYHRPFEQVRPPLTAPGCVKTLDLHSVPKGGEPPSPLGYKWTGNQESPRVKGWKFGQIKADAIARRIPGGDSSDTTECENLTVDGEGNRAGFHLPAEKAAGVQQLHELLTLCEQGTELEVMPNKARFFPRLQTAMLIFN